MIEVVGFPGSDEYSAALSIRDAFVKLWPGIESTRPEEDQILIAANTKLSGYKIADIDVVVGASFGRKRYFVPTKVLKDADGQTVSGSKIRVANFLAAVEVKGQDSSGVRITGDEVNVRYKGEWKSATQQNIDQVHALKQYLSDQYIDAWIYRCLALNGLVDLPIRDGQRQPASGAVALGFGGAEFLTAIAGVYNVRKWGSEFVVSSARQDQMPRALSASIFRKIVPSRLDRVRMDRISARPAEAIRIASLLGRQRVHIRGHGGTGKTILMLQAAHEAYQRHGKRCLILTFNRALVADIQRSMALLRVPGRHEGGGVEVRTAMSFILSWLKRLEVTDKGEDEALERYSDNCSEALEAFKQGALHGEDIKRIIAADEESFDFDAIIVDEAQDWPQPEAELLARIYGGSKIAIADGLDQLIRGVATRWQRTLPVGASADEKSLVECLRMKRNLGVFVNAVASRANLNWSVEPNERAAGGRVLLLNGRFADDPSLQEQLIAEAIQSGNQKIDFLHCVPPSNVATGDTGRHSKLAITFSQRKHEVWDGVDPSVRQDFPRSVDAFRIVQYDSCRGLEGWTCVLEGLDEFWKTKYASALSDIRRSKDYQGASSEEVARGRAWRWMMIPLTRPIDTLVIAFSDQSSEPARVLLDVAKEHSDFVSSL